VFPVREVVVVELVVDEEDDVLVVVVVFCWHTEMLTVLPGAASALAAGVWLSTWPFVAPLAHVESYVALTLKPALDRLPSAPFWN
jgi:hypothetical protein